MVKYKFVFYLFILNGFFLLNCDKLGLSNGFENQRNIIIIKKEEKKVLVEPNQAALEQVKKLKEKYPSASIQWNRYTGFVTSAYNVFAKQNVTTPEAGARAFIGNYSQMFGPGKVYANLQLDKVQNVFGEKKVITNRIVKYKQMIDGIPVYQGEIIVQLTTENTVLTVHNNYKPIIKLEREMQVDQKKALGIAEERLYKETKLRAKRTKIKSIIYPLGDTGIFSYRISLDNWVVIVHGSTGEILLFKDNARYGPDALVYEENPIKTPTPVIKTITNLGAANTLCGARFCTVNQSGEILTSAVQEFRDPVDDVNFDDQMVYYHLEFIATYLNGLGVPGPVVINAVNPLPVEAITNSTNPFLVCNARYDIENDALEFSGAGSGCSGNCRSSAQYADIIYHEFTHRLLDQEVSLIYDSTESGSIHEGTSDYYSDSLLGNSCMAEEWQEGQSCLRDASIKLMYPEQMDDEPHAGGEVWASALWTLRGKLGASIADRIVRQGMIGLPANAEFSTYAGNIITQGVAYYGNFLGDNPWENILILIIMGSVESEAKAAFCEHGIAAPYGTFMDLNILTPPEDTSNSWGVTLPPGYIIDRNRGCLGGYDVMAPGNRWRDLKYFKDHQSDLVNYNVNVGTNSFTVSMQTPGGCDVDVQQVALTYRIYIKPE